MATIERIFLSGNVVRLFGEREIVGLQRLKAPERKSSPSVPRILIVGGGVGALTLAGALRRRGVDPTVVEEVPRYGDVGCLIGLWSMGRVLEHLELGRSFEDLTVPVNNYVLHADGAPTDTRSCRPRQPQRSYWLGCDPIILTSMSRRSRESSTRPCCYGAEHARGSRERV